MRELPERHAAFVVDFILAVVSYQIVTITSQNFKGSYPMRLSLMTVGLTVSLSFSVLALAFKLSLMLARMVVMSFGFLLYFSNELYLYLPFYI